jgi:hypothetical protein
VPRGRVRVGRGARGLGVFEVRALEDDDHRAFGDLVVEGGDVGEVEDDAAPREVAGAVVGPLAYPAVEADAAA